MKNLLLKTGLTIIGIGVVLLLVCCGDGSGGGSSSNQYLGKLPGIAKNYVDRIDGLKKDLEESTDMEESFSLSKEIKLLKKEANKAIEEYVANNPITNIPFEQKVDYKFTIKEVSVHPTYSSSTSYLHLIAKLKVDEDIKNEYGGFERTIFAYVIAVDKEGNSLLKKPGVFASGFKSQNYTKGMDSELGGGISDLNNLVNFEKLVFVSKAEYDKLKYK